MKPIHEMVVLVEPDCVACVRVLETAAVLSKRGLVANLVVLNRLHDANKCMSYGVIIYPAVFINGHLAFYGEFSMEDAMRFAEKIKK